MNEKSEFLFRFQFADSFRELLEFNSSRHLKENKIVDAKIRIISLKREPAFPGLLLWVCKVSVESIKHLKPISLDFETKK